jgi:hypothetical protein
LKHKEISDQPQDRWFNITIYQGFSRKIQTTDGISTEAAINPQHGQEIAGIYHQSTSQERFPEFIFKIIQFKGNFIVIRKGGNTLFKIKIKDTMKRNFWDEFEFGVEVFNEINVLKVRRS